MKNYAMLDAIMCGHTFKSCGIIQKGSPLDIKMSSCGFLIATYSKPEEHYNKRDGDIIYFTHNHYPPYDNGLYVGKISIVETGDYTHVVVKDGDYERL